MTRLALAALVVLAAGCGPLRPVLTPTLISVPRLAPDLVPDQDASTASVTATMPGRGVSGRVFDRDTGAALPGVALDVTDADGTVAQVQTDGSGAFRVAGATGLAAVASNAASRDACHAALDARPAVEAGRSAALIVLLAPVAC